MDFKKNDVVVVEIEDMGHDGAGIGRADGYTLFIKDAVIGDKVEAKIMKAKKNYGYARMIKLLSPSDRRVEPKCPYVKQCGGCQIQALEYEAQLEFKQRLVENNFKKIGGFDQIPILPIIGMENPYYYRNKAQFPIGTDKEGNIITGFYAGRTHDIIANRKCYLGVDINEKILDVILKFLEEKNIPAYDEKLHTGLVRHVLIRYGFVTKEIMVCIIINGRKIPCVTDLVNELQEMEGMTSISQCINLEKSNVIMGKEIDVLWGKGYITDYIGDIKYQISPLSFYQVNPVQTKVLYEKARDYAGLTGDEIVWDLYCGIGTISLFMAEKAKQVYGVEIVPQAIDDARNNAEINEIKNVEFFVGKAETILPEKYKAEGIYADVIVVDPPRKGCDQELLDTIIKMKPEKIVYVSCDSATLARDVKYFCGEDYKMEKVQPIDQFGHTVHVETVALLTRKKDTRIIDVEMNVERQGILN